MEQGDNRACSLSSAGTRAAANREIKARPFRNNELFPGLTSVLASCADMKAGVWAVGVHVWARYYKVFIRNNIES